ncbi:hypothetical protein BH20ACI2_BH20ACI2_19370 [soil metagenome]
MRYREQEPMCETSEKCERLMQREEMLPIGLEIGRRITEVFGYQRVSNIVFRLKSTSREINAIINGENLPSTELLLGIHRVTGASIDWLLTGQGEKFVRLRQIADYAYEPIPAAMIFSNDERELVLH